MKIKKIDLNQTTLDAWCEDIPIVPKNRCDRVSPFVSSRKLKRFERRIIRVFRNRESRDIPTHRRPWTLRTPTELQLNDCARCARNIAPDSIESWFCCGQCWEHAFLSLSLQSSSGALRNRLRRGWRKRRVNSNYFHRLMDLNGLFSV